jgi:hypothetical protein
MERPMTDSVIDLNTGDRRRREPRRRVLKAATAAFNSRNSVINCVVRDLSESGARLRFDGLFRPPHEFDLLIPTGRRHHACEVAWRSQQDIGVRFVA